MEVDNLNPPDVQQDSVETVNMLLNQTMLG